MLLYIVAGERSGDAHAAGLARELRALDPQLAFAGLGGPALAGAVGEAGQIHDWVEQAGVVGLWEVLKMYPWFRRRFAEIRQEIASLKPDAVVLVDYPGLNLRLAKALRHDHPQLRQIYYISPQVWAWKQGRVKTMAQTLDRMICIFPFEADLYQSSGLDTIFAGHPLVDRMAEEAAADPAPRVPGLVGLFPGSRTNELRRLLPIMLSAASQLESRSLASDFVIPLPSERAASLAKTIIATHPSPPSQLRIEIGAASHWMRTCQVAAVKSGTASLEAACASLPYTLVYRVSPLTAFAARRVMRVPFLGMANLLAGREVVRELLQEQATPQNVASELARLLADETYRQDLVDGLRHATAQLGEGDAYARAAKAVLQSLPATTT